MNSTSGKLGGRLWVIAAALLWSTSGVFAKASLFDAWPAETRGIVLAFWRGFFAMLVLAPGVRRPRWNPVLVPMVVCFTAMNVSYLTAMTWTTAANAIWLQSTAPWWVFLFSTLAFREPVVRRDLVPLAFGLLGVGTILGFEFAHSQGLARGGVALGLFSGAAYAGVVVSMRRLREENSPWLVALNHAVAVLAILPWVIAAGRWPSPMQWLVLAGFGVFQMAIPYLCLIRGLRSIGAQEAVAIGLLEPVLNPIWVYLAWRREAPAAWTIAGAGLILLGLLLRYVVWEIVWPVSDEPGKTVKPFRPGKRLNGGMR
jgi:drug/metabolite transporter (DMT)-like permease